MTTVQLINLDWHEEGTKEKIQKALRRIKPLAKYSEESIPLEKIERCVKVLCNSYGYYIRQYAPDMVSSDKEVIWRSEIHTEDLKQVGMVFGCNLYEVTAKTCIFIFAASRKKGGNG